MNIFYKKRYDKFILAIKELGERSFEVYTEVHHIVPRCLKGTDENHNLIRLTLREHFLAHWLLWKAYPEYLPLASAFLQMNNKNSKLEYKGFCKKINSRTYQKLKTEVYNKLKDHTADKVRVKDQAGNIITFSKKEYADQTDLIFHTAGKIYVFDTINNEYVYITTVDYYKNKNRYITRLSNNSPNSVLYQFLDLETREILKISKAEARSRNKDFGYKRLKHIQNHNHRITCIDNNGNKYNISLDEYKNNSHTSIHSHLHKNKLVVRDIETNQTVQITKEEYNLNKSKYITSTKGKVLAKDKNGHTVLISKEQFKTGGFVGQTKGLSTVLDKTTDSYVQVTAEEFNSNKDRYAGPNYGKVNIIDKFTGERKQINKLDFDASKHSSLGNKKFLFRCRNKLTNIEKNVNIYEWHLLKDQYEIIEYDKYVRALNEK